MFLFDRLFRLLIRSGPLTVIDAGGRQWTYGTGSPNVKPTTIRFTDRATPRRIARNPAKGAGEAYMDGRLIVETGDIRDLVDLIGYNTRWDADNSTRVRLWHPQRVASVVDVWNWKRRSKRNVAHHYDLSGALYDLFLDADRQYSCAYFANPSVSLAQAQRDKKAHIASKLILEPGQRVLDIGCGWGGMALYLHAASDVDVLGITLSEEQLRTARSRAEAAGVADRVKFELTDYRDVTGTFDRIVSVGMFEHVGPPHYRAFFEKCLELLEPDGVMLLHTIGRADGPGATDPWLAKYIFPGGYVPALSQIMPAIERSYLWLADLESLRLHYAFTIEHWYDRVGMSSTDMDTRASRNPMAMLVPLLWPIWIDTNEKTVIDDKRAPSPLIGGVPAYAINQFTRIGGQVARLLLVADPEMRELLDRAGVRRGGQPRAVGDLLFLTEGSAVDRRIIWPEGDRLRLPHRALAVTGDMRELLSEGLRQIRSQACLIYQLRRDLFLPFRAR